MGKKLRPCPWCGTKPLYVKKYVYDNKWTQYRVGCEQDDCDAQPTVDWHYLTEQEAIDAWNNQAVAMENESLKAENAKLRELARTLINCADSISVEGVYYERDVDGCGFDCTVNGENCSFAKMCNRARELGIGVD